MKINFVSEFSEEIASGPFAMYHYDEARTKHANAIGVRPIVDAHHLSWLDDLQSSHNELGKRFSRYTRWWWVTPMSRLDARPWGQEYVMKPLLFAKAISCWIKDHPEAKEITLIGCPLVLACYLTEFNRGISVKRTIVFLAQIKIIFKAIKNSIWAFLKLGVEFFGFCRAHAFKKAVFGSGKTLVLYELTSGNSIHSGHKYYYANMFDDLQGDSISYACLSRRKSRCSCKVKEASKGNRAFYLLDRAGLADAVVCFLRNAGVIVFSWSFIFFRQPCRIGGSTSNVFWIHFIFSELKRLSCFEALCCYPALKKVLSGQPYEVMVYPYEEKGIERALLLACEGKKVKTIGYAAHPQHRLTLALRDKVDLRSPKPSQYAVCGEAYVDYFRAWAGKKNNSISVWGSGKDFKKIFSLSNFSGSCIKALLLVSHPNELKVFSSWLRFEARMSEGVEYALRLYKALDSKELTAASKALTDQFKCVHESRGDLSEDLSACDVAAFCATSAGVVAAKHGVLVSQLQLDDFFPINPCFDNLGDMLSCKSSVEFADRLQELRLMDSQTRRNIYDGQQAFVEKIFSAVQKETIRKDIAC